MTKEIEGNRLHEVLGWFKEGLRHSSDMYVVWFCKTLQNWKALVSGVYIQDYIEVTYNGDEAKIYVDVYKKVCNQCFVDGCGMLND